MMSRSDKYLEDIMALVFGLSSPDGKINFGEKLILNQRTSDSDLASFHVVDVRSTGIACK